MKSKLILKIILFLGVLSSTQVFATTEVHTTPLICKPTKVGELTGSNLHRDMLQLQNTIRTDGVQLVEAINMHTLNTNSAITETAKNIQTSMFEVSGYVLDKELQHSKALIDEQSDFELELLSKKLDSQKGNFPNSSKEEIELILKAIQKQGIEGNLNSREIIALLTSQYDKKPENKINISTAYGQKVCNEEDIESGKCAIQSSVTPGSKLMFFFKACNVTKREQIATQRSAQSRKAAIQEEAKETYESVNLQDSSSEIAENFKDSKKIDCTPTEKLSGVCGQEYSKAEFQEAVARCEQIPAGSLSPATALNPTEICGAGLGLRFSEEQIKVFTEEAYDYSELEENPDQGAEAVPIVYTYKNSNQLSAALDYADNIISSELVTNIPPSQRLTIANADFEARFNNRVATLNLAKGMFLDSIKMRTGKNLSEKWSNNEIEDINTKEPVKESYLGAGELDMLLNLVDTEYSKLKQTGEDGNTMKQKEIEGTTEKHWLIKQYEMVNVQNKLLFKQIIQNEKTEILKAAQIQNMVNSPQNIEYLKSLKNN
tara:strand:+ start:9475 stop:11109 length:1635 start_codon:yes stop_codon:yes gene_type:complete